MLTFRGGGVGEGEGGALVLFLYHEIWRLLLLPTLYVAFLWKGKDMHFDHLSSIVNLVFARTDEF